jgi:aryl-alcohol dehydrogenase-like predicted oxidoreductase
MQYGELPYVKKRISRLVQGSASFGSDMTDDMVMAVYDAVFENGCNTFDTAHGYGRGNAERLLGNWIRTRGIRDEVVIIDKGAHPYDGRNRVTPEDITSDVHESLERLGVEKMDIYLLHRDDPALPVEPIVDVLNEHHNAGRIGAFGGSNWTHQRIQAANDYAKANNLVPFVASSPHFSLAEMVKPAWDGCIGISGPSQKAARDWYQQEQMPLFTWASLAVGFMTGKYRRDNLESFTEYFDKVAINAYGYEDNFKRLDRAETLAKQKGVSLPQISLAYVVSQPLNIFALVGNRSAEEFEMNAAIFDIDLSEAEIDWLDLRTEAKPA